MVPRDEAAHRPRLPDDPEVRTADAAPSEQFAHHPLRGIDWDGEADALGHPDDRGVDPDDARPRVDQGATGVARVQRDVSLNDVLDQTARGASQGATQGADDSSRHGRLKPERITDGDDQLAGPERR